MPYAIERNFMDNTTNFVPEYEATSQSLHHAEDAIHKMTSQFFGDELLSHLGIEGEIDHIGSTELTHLELKKFYQDFNYVMKDGSWTHLEFQSLDNGESDLKRFRVYEAVTSQQNDTDVRTYVLYSGNIENPVTELHTGFNTYRVQPIIMKGHRAEELFDNITSKLENHIPLTKDDLVPLTLCPLMGGEIPQKDRIIKAIRIIKQAKNTVSDTNILEAVMYAMANKFLTEVDMNAVKEEIKMSPLGTLIYNDGRTEASIENARNFFANGVSFEIVRDSIKMLSEETLKEIYDEVVNKKQP